MVGDGSELGRPPRGSNFSPVFYATYRDPCGHRGSFHCRFFRVLFTHARMVEVYGATATLEYQVVIQYIQLTV
jgi:hypothetical protein